MSLYHLPMTTGELNRQPLTRPSATLSPSDEERDGVRCVHRIRPIFFVVLPANFTRGTPGQGTRPTNAGAGAGPQGPGGQLCRSRDLTRRGGALAIGA